MWLVTVQYVYLTGRIRIVKKRFITCKSLRMQSNRIFNYLELYNFANCITSAFKPNKPNKSYMIGPNAQGSRLC